MTVELKENERIDDLERNGYQIIQRTDGFCFLEWTRCCSPALRW